MAVEAARDCLQGIDRGYVCDVVLASTTLPFADRQNAGILATALNLSEEISTSDSGGSQRAATTDLLHALNSEPADPNGTDACVASEKRRAKAASVRNCCSAMAPRRLLLGSDNPIARLVASHQISLDFADHYRGEGEDFDYSWEERWVRDEGYRRIVPRALAGLFKKAGMTPGAVDRFIMPGAVAQDLAKRAGIRADAVADTLSGVMGDAGISSSTRHAGSCAGARQTRRDHCRGWVWARLRCDLVQGDRCDRDAGTATRRCWFARAPALGNELSTLSRFQWPGEYGPRASLGARQANRAFGALPQPQDNPWLYRWKVPPMRHRAVPQVQCLRQSQLQRDA